MRVFDIFSAFGAVIDHMEQNAKSIEDLRLKLESKHQTVLSEKEIETRAKEQQLKGERSLSLSLFLLLTESIGPLAYEERLQMQATDFERERKNLQELISRLEVHLSEQTKLVEEVIDRFFVMFFRWKISFRSI